MAKSVKALITSWNMGNAESKGEETLFTQKDNFDIVCLGLQESTYANADCVAIEKAKFITCLGDEFYLVRRRIILMNEWIIADSVLVVNT